VNDAGRQMDILATSTFLRYLELCGQSLTFPSNGYRGAYVTDDIAQKIFAQYGNQFERPVNELFANVPSDAQYAAELDKDGNKVLLSGDKEKHIDGLIHNAQQLLDVEGYHLFHQTALKVILDDIKDDLADFGVTFDQWFSEATLKDDIAQALTVLDNNGFLYEQDGNIWFKSTSFGDEKDRVVKRANGQTTYFAADIAYHLNKFQRGFDQVINIWGSDHHGYVSRVKAAINALGFDSKKLTVLLVQFVSLWRGSEMVQMSSRSGQFVSLRELREEVGNDAARFYYVMRKSEQHIDFDLDLAVSQSKDNAVYYIQYAHARICRLFNNFNNQLGHIDLSELSTHKAQLGSEAESELLTKLAAYPDVLARAAQQHEPHQVGNYLKELAGQLHGWYDTHPIIKIYNEQPELAKARLFLAYCVQQVLKNGLSLLGVSAPETM
jgi:arginyl-tRNA synthetase